MIKAQWQATTYIQLLLLMTIPITSTQAQADLPYQLPPASIAQLIDAPPTPAASLSPTGEWILLLDRPNLPSIEEVAQEELRLAGIRINPRTNGSSRASYYTGMTLQAIQFEKETIVNGLPAKAKIENISWSPDGSHIAFTNTLSSGLELWIVNVKEGKARRLTEAVVNDAMRGLPYRWFSDNHTILYKSIIAERGLPPAPSPVPSGPVIQENAGKTAPVRTYQDLLKNAYDEKLFEYYTNAQLMILDINNGQARPFGDAGIISGWSISPGGEYVLVTSISKPFSYIVPYSRFPQRVDIYTRQGKLLRQVANIPLADNIPKGFGAVRRGPRSFSWRADTEATLYWVEAQDEGDPKKDADIRDRMYYLEAPFIGQPQSAIDFTLRYGGITWGNGGLAMAYEWWWPTRKEITSIWEPDQPLGSKRTLFDRYYEDRYNDPGDFETRINHYGRSVLLTADQDRSLFLMGLGASPEGNRPFVDKFDLATKKTERLWRSKAPYYEYPIDIIDVKKGIVLTRRESKEEPPNFFLRNLTDGGLRQITNFPNPYESLKGVEAQLIRYQRKDGVELSGTLYLPRGYDKERDGRLPVLMWAYPREYKTADAAGQVRQSPFEFLRLYWGSPIYWVTQGYAVFDRFAMPIIGEGSNEPNETFVQQLVSGAEAAIEKLVEMGIADRSRLAIGGHSYGAFMAANLLAHSDLFAAGIARSGAYNRTLTPFGFQSEERTFWEASGTYFKMSPFMHADRIKAPLLLIHGEADNNSGTFPMQSQRFFSALKGHGATVRLVMLPHESHSYRARESIMHMLYEMNRWLEKYVKAGTETGSP